MSERYIITGEDFEEQYIYDTKENKSYWIDPQLTEVLKLINKLSNENTTLKKQLKE
jgi:hypothetical protein